MQSVDISRLRHSSLLLGVLAAVLLFATFMTFAVASRTPVYVDELNWLMIKARLMVDGFATTRISPTYCIPLGFAPWPWFMVPFRLADEALFSFVSSPWAVRVVGCAFCALWLATTLALAIAYLRSRFPPAAVTIFILSTVTLGVLPALLVLNRPEQGLLLMLTIIILLPFVVDSRSRLNHRAVHAGATLLAALVLFSIHPKGVFFTPLLLAVLYCWARRSVWSIAIAIVIVASAVASAAAWQSRIACPESAVTQAILDGHSLSLSALSKPGTAVQELLKNAAKGFGLVAYVKSVLFQSSYMANWLPPGSALGWRAFVVNALIIVSLLSIVGIITQFLYSALLGRQEGVRDQAIIVSAALVSLGALAVVQVIKNAYEATLVVPLLIVIAILTLKPVHLRPSSNAVTVSLGLIASFSLLSQMHFWTVMTPAFSARASGAGYITDQPNSVEATRRMAALKEARKVAAQCGIADDQSSKHILVDHVTYFALSHSYRPILHNTMVGLTGPGAPDLKAFMSAMRSGGAVLSCNAISGMPGVTSFGDGHVCCIRP